VSPPRPDDPALADGAAAWRGAYVHVPFCARLCPYCDFAVVAGRDDATARYVDAVVAEVEMEPRWGALDAVYFGGGTPSRLPATALRRVLDALRDRFGIAADAEVSLEANPEDWSEPFAADVLAAGFTRVSLGVQSFDDAVLGSLGRMHDAADARRAVAAAHRAGFGTVSVDLIFGTPGESIASWHATVAAALECEPAHVSTYALTVERGTALGRAVAAGAPAPDGDDQADKWEHAGATIGAAGLVRYEVSNHAAPGHACRYNLLTWAQGDYLAFGLGAHGHRDGFRRRNVRRLDAYLTMVERGERPEAGRESVAGWAREQERLLVGLRRAAGVVAGPATERLTASDWGRRLVGAGVIAAAGGRLTVSRPLLGDEVARAVLALDPPEC
jgi:oxygen-independent coproporphyrinogen-3 oxidase